MQQDSKNTQPESPEEVYYPSFMFKEIVMMMIIFILVAVVLAGFFPAGLEDPADPTDNLYVPKPEWYFLFLYQLLKYIPGKFEAIATAVVSIGGFFVLLALPFLDRRAEKRPGKRPIAMATMVIAVLAIVLLTVFGLAS
jgi:quinol-cytochrome oxidoreductase complex cytochrome b subunit